ncbi:hypothetical protein ACLNGM_02390 [Aureimonas phyllosphaerae]|uniref:hypothetical protein n=1 Tax=Aureimonas phyllosphaerae TaxID=1166078 RepID=UPI003A5BF3E6
MTTNVQNWVQLAHAAKELLASGVPRGSGLRRETEVATTLGTTRATVRNALAAVTVVDHILRQDAKRGSLLMTLPIDIVRAYDRWQRRDPTSANEALELAALHKLSVRGFVAAEHESRNTVAVAPRAEDVLASLEQAGGFQFETTPAEALEQGMRRLGVPPFPLDLLSIVRKLDRYDAMCGLTARAVIDAQKVANWRRYRSLIGRPFVDDADLNALLVRVENVEAKDDAGSPVLGIMEIADHPVIEQHRRQAKTRYLKAAAASAIYPGVVILMPSQAARDEMLAAIPPLPYDRLGIEATSGKGTSKRRKRGPVLHPGRGQGAVVITCPQTALEDLVWQGAELRRQQDEAGKRQK